MTRALSVNNKDTVLLVEFRYGDPDSPTYTRMTSWSQDVSDDGHTYTSTPALEIDLASNIGTLEDRETSIKLPLELGGFSDLASNGEPHSPIFITVRERSIDPTSVGSTDDLTLFKGQARSSVRNVGGRSGVVAIQCVPIKNQLRVPLGIPCNNQCEWTLGDQQCKVDVTSLAQSGTLASVSRRSVIVTGLVPPGGDGDYFARGYMTRGGLWIGIRAWTVGSPTLFDLVQPAPAAWVGQSVLVVPGCNKTLETCRARFSNEANFGGMGYAMPSWHPAIEGP